MARYDALPTELRRWMAQAVLPWSSTSCLRIWYKARPGGVGMALATLEAAEQATLMRDGHITASASPARDRRLNRDPPTDHAGP